ncbi:three component ABC system middle component [Comamonas endophytica]|uniref:DUF6521 family protein n=1 Tax=Comamonas endophytica TaxID=2949090 RepID=A0ABY6G8G5_9BURK|nr:MULTISPECIES: three component ABC system middle component [unclassified Acidovorax]MCD2514188.1 DUF6521 family protein [Acidovorax sp. D4N7]UYG51327.1 DUF6521 family protein [Acidovorax sp. 5MLIR]
MAIAHDIFAETNPAYCASLLATFVRSYRIGNKSEPDITLCYAALPLALSGDLTPTFNGTNRRTGLLEWLRRSPVIQIRLAARVNGSLDIVTEAIRFGCFSNLLEIKTDGKVAPGMSLVPKQLRAELTQDTRKNFDNIDRIGHWFASAGSTRTVFNLMGLEL